MKKYYLYLFSVLILLSCLKNRDIVRIDADNFKTHKSLIGEEIFKNEYSTTKISVIDSFIILKQSLKDTCFKVYNSDLEYLGNFGKIGDGPDELLAPRFDGQKEVSSLNVTKLWLNNRFKNQMLLINLDSTLLKNNFFIEKKIEFNPDLNFTQNVLNAGNLFIGNRSIDAIDSYWFKIFNSNTKEIITNTNLPTFKNSNLLKQYDWYTLLHSSLRIKPDNSKFVSSMTSFDRIGIFDMKGKIVKEILGSEFKDFDAKDHLSKGTIKGVKIYYQGLHATDRFIYALYYNQLVEDYSNPIPVQIRVFDWEGNPIMIFEIPDYLMTFSVDKTNSYIYGNDHFNEKILRYDIKSILDEASNN